MAPPKYLVNKLKRVWIKLSSPPYRLSLPFVGKQRAILYSTWKSVGETEPLKLKIKCDSVRVTLCPWFCFPPPSYPPVILFCIWLLLSWLPSQFDSSSLTRFLSSLISSFLWYKATSSFFSFFFFNFVSGDGGGGINHSSSPAFFRLVSFYCVVSVPSFWSHKCVFLLNILFVFLILICTLYYSVLEWNTTIQIICLSYEITDFWQIWTITYLVPL